MSANTPLLKEYAAETLVLLVGENPLPNYVAAQLLAKPAQTAIWLVHSEGTREQKEGLREMLGRLGYRIETLEIADSDPTAIQSSARKQWKTSQGVHVHYTGGTKSMAVNVMRTLGNATSSYLDARTLSLWVEEPGKEVVSKSVQMRVPVTLTDLLKLHRLGTPQSNKLRQMAIWPSTRLALAERLVDPTKAEEWRAWCNDTLRRPAKQAEFKADGELKRITSAALTGELADALTRDLQMVVLPLTFEEIGKLGPVGSAVTNGVKLAEWLDGEWFEDYVGAELQALATSCQLHDISMGVKPEYGVEFEFDVAAMQGYRLFAISVSTTKDKKLCKSKLLEAVIRAQQLGGAEARTGLVCAYELPEELEKEIGSLTRTNQLRVFGRKHIDQLGPHLAQWIGQPK